MENDNSVEVGRPPPLIESVHLAGGHRVRVVLNYPDGETVEKTVDLAPLLWSKRIFIPLRDDVALFATVRINEDGTALEFGDGDVDISAEWIERQPEATMTPQEFRRIMDELMATNKSMALQLGIAKRLVARYRKDGATIPLRVSLAARYVRALNDESLLFRPEEAFKDTGIELDYRERLKSELALAIRQRIDELGLTQEAAAKIIGADRANVSLIARGHLAAFSVERLFRFNTALGGEATTAPARKSRPAGATRVPA